jgi:hypothetical protein
VKKAPKKWRRKVAKKGTEKVAKKGHKSCQKFGPESPKSPEKQGSHGHPQLQNTIYERLRKGRRLRIEKGELRVFLLASLAFGLLKTTEEWKTTARIMWPNCFIAATSLGTFAIRERE